MIQRPCIEGPADLPARTVHRRFPPNRPTKIKKHHLKLPLIFCCNVIKIKSRRYNGMSSDGFWDLFTETGDIGFYLLYVESAEKPGLQHSEQMISGEKCEFS
jgi:hypothetical protein